MSPLSVVYRANFNFNRFMIESLTIDNFRGIRHLDVHFGERMNLFAGENGAGKSTVLQALRYL